MFDFNELLIFNLLIILNKIEIKLCKISMLH